MKRVATVALMEKILGGKPCIVFEPDAAEPFLQRLRQEL